MARCPRWMAQLSTVAHLKPLEQPNQPMAITREQLTLAMEREPSPVIRAALEIGWLAAARGSDVRQLLIKDFLFNSDTKTISLTFRRGKTTKSGQYAVGIPFPSQETLDFLKARQAEGSWAFPTLKGEHLKLALRRVNPFLEQRSLRRGRLQHLSTTESWSDEELIKLSCHASIPMLRRYLDMGTVSATTLATAVHAARTSATSPAAH